MRFYCKWYYIQASVCEIQGKVDWLQTCIQNEVHCWFTVLFAFEICLAKNLCAHIFSVFPKLAYL